jgi:hemin uptake protein HemP
MSEVIQQPPDGDGAPFAKSEDSPKVVSAQELFDGQREICIEHEGEVYRLRITRRNKLILQK